MESFPHLSRFGVMKHLEVLRQAGLVQTREQGRQRVNSLNVFPIRRIYERWVSPFQEMWSSQLLGIKAMAEKESTRKRRSRKRSKESIRSPEVIKSVSNNKNHQARKCGELT